MKRLVVVDMATSHYGGMIAGLRPRELLVEHEEDESPPPGRRSIGERIYAVVRLIWYKGFLVSVVSWTMSHMVHAVP